MNRYSNWASLPALALALAWACAAQPITATIDAARVGQPITKFMFGGFMEPATTQIWAEMLSDRKFFGEINSKPDPPPPPNGFGRMGRPRRWRPVGVDSAVTMDTKNPYVGEHSPLIRLEGAAPRGISQSELPLVAGKAYTGRVVLAGGPGVKVEVSLAWGPNPGDRQTVSIPSLAAGYAKFPLKFTARAGSADGRLEIVGTGSGTFQVGAVSLMPADNISGFKPGMVRLLKEQGIMLLRWPGGNFVSAYDWRDGIGDADQRPPRLDLAWGRLESNDMGIDDFLTLCRLMGAEPYIAVNTGLGDAHSAAEEVEYVNGAPTTRMGQLRASGGRREPYNVKIWGVGNEMYGPWQWGYMSLRQFWNKHNLVVKAMRKVDPTIKLIASSATIEEMSWCAIDQEQFSTNEWRGRLTKKLPFEYGSHEDWTGGLLANSADYIDYLGEHFYAYPHMTFNSATQRFEDAGDSPVEKVRRLSNKVAYKFEAWEEYLKRIPGLKDKNIKFALDEWGPRFRSIAGGNVAPGAGSGMIGPLSNALVFHEFFRHSDMIVIGVATGGMGTLTTDASGDATGYRLEGLVMKVLHDHFAGALPVAVTGSSPQHPIKGTVGVDTSQNPSGSATYPVDVSAALSADRRKLAVSVVNPAESPQECDLNITGVKTGGPAKLWQVTSPANMAELSLPQPPVRITVPPSSVNVYEFEVR
jgi:alpha-L-arabinofuranosidase